VPPPLDKPDTYHIDISLALGTGGTSTRARAAGVPVEPTVTVISGHWWYRFLQPTSVLAGPGRAADDKEEVAAVTPSLIQGHHRRAGKDDVIRAGVEISQPPWLACRLLAQ
jgi:hypothetical protein